MRVLIHKKTCNTLLFCWFLFSCQAFQNNRGSKFSEIVKNSNGAIPYYQLEKDDDLDVLIREIGDARIVLLGESTHGTHEYYTWRAAITKKLIEEKGFDFMAVEGDWDDSYKINQFLDGPTRDGATIISVLRQYDRWPASMWSNYEMSPLLQWVSDYNQGSAKKIGFYGLDLYSFWEWTQHPTVINDTAIENAVQRVRDFFAVYDNDAMAYADSLRHGKLSGSFIVQHLWNEVQKVTGKKQPKDDVGFLLYQHALLALKGELYFRTLTKDHVKAINIRDAYMAETLTRLMNFYGPHSKAVVWVHNGHASYSNYSTMSESGYTNMGQILRNQWGHGKIYCVGFGTYKGTVMAGYTWGGHIQKQSVLPAKGGSWEYLLHGINSENKIIFSKDIQKNGALNKWIEFRSIGAAYEGAAIYSRSIIPKRFDAFVFVDSTTALHPIENIK
jgi:erythromycin esterase